MKKLLFAALALLLAASPAAADVAAYYHIDPVTGAKVAIPVDDSANPLPTSAGGGGGSSPSNSANYVSGVTAAMTGTTSTQLLAAPGASLRNYLTQITCGNSHATVGTFVNVQDGSGGTTIYSLPAAAVYGGSTVSLPTPLRQPTTNTGLYVVDATTGANVICSGAGYKGA